MTKFFIASVQPHYILPDHEVINYIKKNRETKDYLKHAIRLRIQNIIRSKYDVNMGAPIPPAPNIMEIEGSLPYKDVNARKHFEEGLAWKRIKEHEKAIFCFEFALIYYPNDWYIHQELGEEFFAIDKIEAGLTHFKRSIELNAYSSVPFEHLAIHYNKIGERDKAIELLLSAPTTVSIFLELYEILEDCPEYYEVLKEALILAIELQPDYSYSHHYLAILSYRLSDYKNAIEEAKIAFDLKPDYDKHAVLIAQINYKIGLIDECRKYLLIAQKINPLNNEVRAFLEQINSEISNPGEPDKTIIDLKKILINRKFPQGTSIKLIKSEKAGCVSVNLRLPSQKNRIQFLDIPVKNGTISIPITIVFLCHVSEDKETVIEVGKELERIGFITWLDKKDLLPGDNWEDIIEDAIDTSDFVLVFLSQKSIIKKDSHFHREIQYAIERTNRNPENNRFIIPLKIDDLNIPKKLSKIQCVDKSNLDWLERIALAMTPSE